MTIHILEDMFTYVDAATTKYVIDGAAAVAGALTPTAHTLLIVYVSLWGLAVMAGKVAEPVMDGVVRVVKASLIVTFATSSALYASDVANFLYDWPAALVGVMNGGAITNTTQIIDNALSQTIDLGTKAWELAGWQSIGLYYVALAIWVMGGLVAGIAAFIIITSKIGLALLLALGPIFILMLMFDVTREFFNKWLGSVITSGFTIVLISMASQLIMKYYAAGVEAGAADAAAYGGIVSMVSMMPAALTAIIAIPLMISIPSLASGLGGGVSAGTAGIAGFAYGKIKGAAGGTLRMGGKGAVAGGKAAYNKARSSGRFGRGQGQGGSIQGGRSGAPMPMAIYRKITSRATKSA